MHPSVRVARVLAAGDGTRVPIPIPFRLNGHGVRVFLDPRIPPDSLVPIRFGHPEMGSTRVQSGPLRDTMS